MEVQAQSSKAAEEGVVTDWSAKSHRARDMLQVVVRVGPHKVKGRTILHRDGDGRIAVADPKRTGSMSESTIIRACALSRTTQKRDSRVSSFDVGTVIWPDGDLGETIGAKATEDALNGFNVSIFAYGATGSEKTFSLFGVPNTSSSAGGDLGLLHKICGDLLHRGVESLDHFQQLMVEATDGHITRVNMVDLAGSERGCSDRESLQVRRDLSNLGAVLRGISSRKTAAIPFRESTLTSFLKDSLSLRARTTVLATVSSSPSSYSKNINTLKYAELLHVTANGGRTDAKPLDDKAIKALVTELQGADKGSRREVFRHVTSDPRQVLAKAIKEMEEKVDRSPKDRQHLDNVDFGRCVRNAVLEEAFSWVPDPVAEELAEMEDERSRSRLEEEKEDSPGEAMLEEPLEDHGDGVDVREGVCRETMEAQEEEGIEDNDIQMLRLEEKAEEEVKEENWLAGEDLEGFEGDWMALVRRRTGRVEQMTLGKEVRKGRGEGEAAMARNAAGLEENACVVDKRRTRNARKGVVDGLKAEVAALKLQLTQQRAAYANHFAEERQLRLKEREEDEARARAIEARLLERLQQLEGLLANEAQHRVMNYRDHGGTSEPGVGMGGSESETQGGHASAGVVASSLGDGVEQHREVMEVPRRAHAPRYTRILWICGVVLGTFGLLSVTFMLYLNVTYGRKVI